MFDSIIENAAKKLGINNQTAASILSALLAYMSSSENGGFSGSLAKFTAAGLGSSVESWISGATSETITADDVRSAFGEGGLETIAADAGVDNDTAADGIAVMLPDVVDTLTPDAEMPDDDSILSQIGGYIADLGGVIGGAVAAGAAATATVVGDAGRSVSDAAETVHDKAKDVLDSGFGAIKNTGDVGSRSPSGLNWLLLIIPLLVMIALSYFACGQKNEYGNKGAKSDKPASNAAAKSIDASFSIKAVDGKYTITGVMPDEATKKRIMDTLTAQYGAGNINFDGLKVDPNAKPFAAGWWDNFSKMLPDLKDWKAGTLSFAGNAITETTGLPSTVLDKLRSLFSGWSMPNEAAANADGNANKSLAELTLPDGTKLQAFPGGIEDQLIKFVGSDEFSNATADSLKNRWFNFDDLTFKFGTTELDGSSKRQLDNIAVILKAFPNVKIKIGGYTDRKGDDAANLKLSDGRAKAVKAALEKAGVGSQVPEAEGFGEEFATVDENASDEARKVDRKTAIRLIK